MIRDIRFAMCNTRHIKKSQTFRSLDLSNTLKLVPIREHDDENDMYELARHESNHRLIKSKSACGNYHSVSTAEIPPPHDPELTVTTMNMATNSPHSSHHLTKANSLEIYDNVNINARDQYHRNHRHHRYHHHRHQLYNQQDHLIDNKINAQLNHRLVNNNNNNNNSSNAMPNNESEEFYA